MLGCVTSGDTAFFCVRYNLDPFKQHSDSELWTALERAHLREMVGFSSFLKFFALDALYSMCYQIRFDRLLSFWRERTLF